jgi:hypothetical protein
MRSFVRGIGKVITPIIDGEDCKIIAVIIIVILVIGVMMIMMGAFAGVAVAVFDAMRAI